METLFVTSSGTETGKTYVTTAIAAAAAGKGLRVRVLKPVITGFEPDDLDDTDTVRLLRSLGLEPTADAMDACSPWRFRAPLSPDMAARREGREIDFHDLVRFCREAADGAEDLLLIEGIGGAMVPLDSGHTVLDWMAALDAPAVVVVGSYLGTLSHTLTTVAALEGDDVEIAGVVVDESDLSPVPLTETAGTLSRFLPGLPVAAVPRGAGPEDVYAALAEIVGV